MNRYVIAARWLCLCAFLTGTGGCLPYKERIWVGAPLHQASIKETSNKRIRSGDLVRVRSKSGKTWYFRIYKAEADGFVGVQKEKHYPIRFADLEWMEVQRDEWDYVVLGLPIRM